MREEVLAVLRRCADLQLIFADVAGFRFRHALTREAVLGRNRRPDADVARPARLRGAGRKYLGLPGMWCELVRCPRTFAGVGDTPCGVRGDEIAGIHSRQR